MKRLGSSDSLGALISVYATDGQSPRSSQIYNREFQSMLGVLDEEGYMEENVHEKKRRLSVDQVKALEKNFEIENKLEPERKVKLAQDLGLQPRQVAVWFQNRRARWKTKQLERDYGVLKANYESLKVNYDSLQKENEALSREIKELRSKLNEEDGEKNPEPQDVEGLTPTNMKLDDFKNGDASAKEEFTVFPNLKDGSSESDSSVILQEENSSNIANSSLKFSTSSSSPVSSMGFFPFSQKGYQPQFVKMEEHNFLGSDEACNFFSDEHAPSMPWFGSDQWG